ncbi:hypothetical protein RDI58_030032 [Solanum bulbocastanum]|uniref:Uncharacterized protein n=1 Tax=Solanum bulbocastanum TaxID=147425 RepID=A0AAN8Y2R5_SOLBU
MAMDTANRLSAIAAEMGQLQNEIQEHRRVLNFLLRSVRTMDPARKEARIRATRERIEAAGTFPASSSGNLPIQHIVSGILPGLYFINVLTAFHAFQDLDPSPQSQKLQHGWIDAIRPLAIKYFVYSRTVTLLSTQSLT